MCHLFRILKLPYKGRRTAMYILLPDTTSDLPTLENSLSDDTLHSLDQHLDPQPRLTFVTLPRFRLEQSLDLVTPLRRLGAVQMFLPGSADFSGMTGQERIHVDAIVQKAFIEVTESGTEAAAATGVTFRSGSVEEPLEFLVDRPFLFLIKDEETNMVWFMGRFIGGSGEQDTEVVYK